MRDELKCYLALDVACKRYKEMTFDELCLKPAWKFRQVYVYSDKLRIKYNILELARIFIN